MNEYISFDSHKHYTLMEREDIATGRTQQRRIDHAPGAIRQALAGAAAATPVALEAIGNWYWIVDEIEQAGLLPLLVHPRKAKLMMGMLNKTDKLDVHGLNRLQRNHSLPTVWIPPGPVRDLRELTRTRLVLVRSATRYKNRIQATLAKHALSLTEASDTFAPSQRAELARRLGRLPPQAAYATGVELEHLDALQARIDEFNCRLTKLAQATPQMQLLMTLPGVGAILATTLALEIGDVSRFPDDSHLAAYAGVVPRVHSSGGRVRHLRSRPDVNRYLKWALAEAANVTGRHHKAWADRHVAQLYHRVRARHDHARAIGAVSRHLAQAAFHILRKREPYRDPAVGSPPLSRTTKV